MASPTSARLATSPTTWCRMEVAAASICSKETDELMNSRMDVMGSRKFNNVDFFNVSDIGVCGATVSLTVIIPRQHGGQLLGAEPQRR
eukprot:7070614-Heterocapsa_arctica.AAC.1